ncbi:MAG TPA: LptF/LptG family permease [Parachlamydiaceae bacterium]|nr:LptF/LptG family permease [Parachlamydiaceae bacterium]
MGLNENQRKKIGLMILTTIWERYFLRETVKVFILFLVGFYGLYALIDYSTHASSFKHYQFSFLDILKFYAFEFVTKMDVLVPFALLIATVKTLCSLNTHNELVALMASGIKLKRLLLPFVALGLFLTALMYFNTEVLHPMAMRYNTKLDHSRAKAKHKKFMSIQQLSLEDNSLFIFQEYDTVANEFFDSYWVRSIDDIYRIHRLSPYSVEPVGKAVERLQRTPEGFLVLTESVPEKTFSDMHFNKEKLLETVSLPDAHSLSELKEKLPSHGNNLSEKEAALLTTYYYKLAMPWLCLLAVLAPAPFCIRFSRTMPVFFIYSLSIFGLVAFYLIMDATFVLGERQMFPPALAIWTPFTLFFSFFGWRFLRL